MPTTQPPTRAIRMLTDEIDWPFTEEQIKRLESRPASLLTSLNALYERAGEIFGYGVYTLTIQPIQIEVIGDSFRLQVSCTLKVHKANPLTCSATTWLPANTSHEALIAAEQQIQQEVIIACFRPYGPQFAFEPAPTNTNQDQQEPTHLPKTGMNEAQTTAWNDLCVTIPGPYERGTFLSLAEFPSDPRKWQEPLFDQLPGKQQAWLLGNLAPGQSRWRAQEILPKQLQEILHLVEIYGKSSIQEIRESEELEAYTRLQQYRSCKGVLYQRLTAGQADALLAVIRQRIKQKQLSPMEKAG